MAQRGRRGSRLGGRALAFALTIALGVLTGDARADDKQRCATSYEQAQALQKSGKLRAARSELVQCAQASCPTVVREDCARALPDLEASLPTVVIEAFDLAGAQTTEVRVSVDGTMLEERLDGRAVPVDPGKHTFRYELGGAEPVEQAILVLEGDKRRKLQVRFTQASAPAPAAGGEDRRPPDPGPPIRPFGVVPWVAVGVGAAAMTVGGVLIGVGRSTVADAEERCPNRICTDVDATDDGNRGRRMVNIGLITLAAGGAIAVSGLVWQLALNAPERAARIRPIVGPRLAGLTASARF